MTTSDWRKDLKELYFPHANQVVEVTVPKLRFLTIEGEGDPNSNIGFQRAIEALYAMSYTLKFTLKKADATKDFKVGPLEGLWWNTKDGGLVQGKKEDWVWKAMILQPSTIEDPMVNEARQAAMKRKVNPSLKQVKLEEFEEGRSAQIMHVGPWNAETENIMKVKVFIEAKGGALNGKHHEIYMSDPRRVESSKLKTIIRQPFK